MPTVKSLPHLLPAPTPNENSQKKGKLSSKNFRMVSPKVKIHNAKKLEDKNL